MKHFAAPLPPELPSCKTEFRRKSPAPILTPDFYLN